MKTQLMKKTLAALALASLGLAATGAQAEGGRGGYGSGNDSGSYYHQDQPARYGDHGRFDTPRHGHAYQQSLAFSQQLNARQDRQMDRIRAGMRSGTLTRGEFRSLMHEQHDIRAMEQHFLADGFIDAREFQRLDRALDIASHNIRDEKHDRQARYAYNHHPWFN